MPKITKKSSVTKAREGSASFRTTIPHEIAELLEVEHKDKIAWEAEVGAEEIEVVVSKREE